MWDVNLELADDNLFFKIASAQMGTIP